MSLIDVMILDMVDIVAKLEGMEVDRRRLGGNMQERYNNLKYK